MPEYFQYHFCKWYCVLSVLQNTVVSPTYRYTHTQSLSAQGLPRSLYEQLPGVPTITLAIRWFEPQPAVLQHSDTQEHIGLKILKKTFAFCYYMLLFCRGSRFLVKLACPQCL